MFPIECGAVGSYGPRVSQPPNGNVRSGRIAAGQPELVWSPETAGCGWEMAPRCCWLASKKMMGLMMIHHGNGFWSIYWLPQMIYDSSQFASSNKWNLLHHAKWIKKMLFFMVNPFQEMDSTQEDQPEKLAFFLGSHQDITGAGNIEITDLWIQVSHGIWPPSKSALRNVSCFKNV